MDDGPGSKAPKQGTRTGDGEIARNTPPPQPGFVGLGNWTVLTKDNFREPGAQAPNRRIGANQDRANATREASSYTSGGYSRVTPQSQYPPLPQQGHMGGSMGETINVQSSVNPVLLAQDAFTSSTTSPIDAARASGYPPGMFTGSGTDRYNEGFIAGALYREAQSQIPKQSVEPKEWTFINLGPEDFEDTKKVGRNFAQTITPSLNVGSSHQNQRHTSAGTADASRLPKVAGRLQSGVPEPSVPAPYRAGNTGSTLEGQMPQSYGSATYGGPIPNNYQGFGIPQAPGVAPDSGQFHVSGAQSSSEMQNKTEGYQNWDVAGLSGNNPSDNNAPGVGASFVGSGRGNPISSGNQPEISITPPPAVSEQSHGALAASFPQNSISAQQDVGQFLAPPQKLGDLLNSMDPSLVTGSIPATDPPFVAYREPQQPQQSLELQFGKTVSIHDRSASQTSTQTSEGGSAHMCRRIIGTTAPQVEQQGSHQFPTSPHIGMGSQMSSENSIPSSMPVIEGTDSQNFGDSWSENDVQPVGAQIGTTGTDSASVRPGDFPQIQADRQSDYVSAFRASRFAHPQAISNQAQVVLADVADQMQPYTASTNLGPSGSILQSAPATTCLNSGFSSTNNGLGEQSLPIATPAVTQEEHSIAASLPSPSAQRGTNTNLPVGQQGLLRSSSENQPGSGANNQGFPGPVQYQDRLLNRQPFPLLPYNEPTEPIRRNRYVPDEVIYDTRGVSASNNRAQVSGRLGVNPTQAGTPIVAQPGGESSAQALVNLKKRQRKRVSNSPASKPAAKKARFMPPEAQVGSSHTGAREVVDARHGNNSASAGSSSSAPTEGNTNYPYYVYPPAATEPQGGAPTPQVAYLPGKPNQELREKMLKELPAMVAKQDAILKKFEEYKQVYGPNLYPFYMGDRTGDPRAELKIPVPDDVDAEMQSQGNDLLQVTQDISNALLQVIMNMTHEQAAPNFLSLMYFSSSATLRNSLPAVDRVANTRLMANLVLAEEARLKALAEPAKTGTGGTDPAGG